MPRYLRLRRHRPRRLVEQLEDRINLNAGIGTFDARSAGWALRASASPGDLDVGSFQYGLSGQATVPVVGDWNGDQIDDIGTFNQETATWSLRFGASEGLPDAGVFQFGGKDEIPVVGDWNGDGRDDIGTFDPKKAVWSLRFGASAGPANAGVFRFGVRDSLPVVGDWDGDGTDGIGTYIRGSTTWTLRLTASAGVADAGAFRFGERRGLPVVGDWNGDGVDGIGTFVADTANWTLKNIAAAGAADVGTFQLGVAGALPIVGDFINPAPGENTILNLVVKPLDIDLLGLKVQSSPITVTVNAHVGDGRLLGNLLTTVDQVLNLDQINSAVNNVLGATVDLLNSASLAVEGVGSGVFDDAEPSATQVLELFVAPVNLDLMGAIVTTSPIRLSVSAQTGDGLVLGNVLTVLSDLFNGAPAPLDLNLINDLLAGLLGDLRAQLPNFSSVEVPPPTLAEGDVLALTVPAIDLDLLGLLLKTTPITVDVSSREGDGLLVGNVLASALGTLGATPEQLGELSGHVNNTLNYIVAVLNKTTLTLPPGAVDQLSELLQQLTLPDLVTAEPGQTAKILDLVIAQPDGSPPVNVDLLGLNVQVGNIDAELSARTGEGQILGNLLYNVANLVNPGGIGSLIDLLTQLGGGATSNLGDVIVGLSPTAADATPVLTLTVPPLDIDLLGVEVKTTAPITVTVSALEGDGLLLGNVLTAVSSLLNTDGISSALNNVLDTVVGILNNLDLLVDGIGGGVFDTAPTSVTPIADLKVAPVRLDLLGALVETSQIHLTITAFAGEGLVLGNVLTALSDLFNNPPDQLDLNFINTRLEELLSSLNEQIPIPVVPPTTPPLGEGDILALTVPALDIDLLGLVLETEPITVNASATTGDGLLLGNVLTSVLATLDATPEELTRLNSTLNTVLAKVFAVLNGATSLLPAGLPDTLSDALQTLGLFDLIAAEPGATATILDLTLTDTSGTPVSLDALGLLVTTSNIDVTLSAHTGEDQILGNLLYNIANLLNPDSSLLSLLLLLSLSGTSQPTASTFDIDAAEIAGQVMLPGVNVVGGRLLVGGSPASDVLSITGVGKGTSGQYVVVFNGVSQTVSGVTGDIEIDLFAGDDRASINNAFVNGSIDIDMESGHDSVTLGSQQIVSTRHALSVLLGDGNDMMTGQRLYIGGNQSVSGDGGNDQISFLGSAGTGPFVLGTSSGGATSISGGLGNDRITATYSFIVGAWGFVGGAGDDVISVGTSACINGVTVAGGDGLDTLVVDTNFFPGNLLMDGGADTDRLELRNSLGLVSATLNSGPGTDAAFISNLTASRLSLNLGAGNDTADVRGSLFDDFFAHLGDHDDSLTLYGNLVRRPSTADGGAGGDALVDLGNGFLRGLQLERFE